MQKEIEAQLRNEILLKEEQQKMQIAQMEL